MNEEFLEVYSYRTILHSSFKYREVHAPVYPSLHKVRMFLETVFLPVFQNEEGGLREIQYHLKQQQNNESSSETDTARQED